jgi:hypothetical protein
LLEVMPGTQRARISALGSGGVYCPYLSIPECDSVEVVEEGVWWIDMVFVRKDKRDSELPVNHAGVDFFDLRTKLCQITKLVSSSVEIWTIE